MSAASPPGRRRAHGTKSHPTPLPWAVVSTQIAVRLPEELVEFIDRLVAQGRAPSRAAVVSRAIRREQRRELASRDAAILAAAREDDDLDSLAEHAARTPLDLE